jgi:CheY-like chemotaxis protein
MGGRTFALHGLENALMKASLAGKRVLVVEDDDDARDLIEQILNGAGCVVSTASSAFEALERLGEVRPEVLVSDIGMPDRDGYWLMEQVRALDTHEGRDVPAVAVTAYTTPADRSRALTAGFTAHLSKPVRSSELLAVLRDLTSNDC